MRIFIGVAWPYANGPFHIGHLAGAYLPADTFGRYHRLRGNEVLMVSGSDMHGTPALLRAEAEGTTAEAIARRFDAVNRDAFRRLGFAFDLFTHTHTLLHERTVQELFLRLLENGFITRLTEENAYCSKHARFLPDRYLTGTCPHCDFPGARGDECDNCGRVLEPRQLKDPKCGIDGTAAEFRPSEHFYLDLGKLEPKITQFVDQQTHWRPTVVGGARNFLTHGLRPTPITRDLDWGVPIPLEGYESKRFYVWFDAVIGYLSASREWAVRAGRPAAWERYWRSDEQVRPYYFIGKDNVFHHTIVWPGILLGVGGLHLPFDVPANQWMLVEGGKISKSRAGSGDATMPQLLERYAPDVIRFYATLLAPQNHDTEFDPDELERVSEEVLSNQYGNLVQRLLVLLRDRYSGQVPSPPNGWTHAADQGVPARVRSAHGRITEEFEAVHPKEALDLALAELREGNRWFQEARPWSASDEDRRRTVYEALWLVKAAAVWLAPVLPFSSAEVFRMLGYPEAPGPGDWDEALRPVPPGQPLGDIRPLFPRIERDRPKHPVGQASMVTGSIPEEPQLEIRAARVRKVEPHPSGDRLYVLTLDAGDPKPRTVVVGVRAHYRPEELAGRRVALLANLRPRTIRRVTSQGMVLAAEAGASVKLLDVPDHAEPGARLTNSPHTAAPIEIEAFSAIPLIVGRVLGPKDPDHVIVDTGDRQLVVPGGCPTGTTVIVRVAVTPAGNSEILGFSQDGWLTVDPSIPPGSRVR